MLGEEREGRAIAHIAAARGEHAKQGSLLPGGGAAAQPLISPLLPTLQVFWFCSALIGLPVLMAQWRRKQDSAQFELLAAAAAVGSVFSLLFLLKSLLSFDPTKPVRLWSGLVRGREAIAWDVKKVRHQAQHGNEVKQNRVLHV